MLGQHFWHRCQSLTRGCEDISNQPWRYSWGHLLGPHTAPPHISFAGCHGQSSTGQSPPAAAATGKTTEEQPSITEAAVWQTDLQSTHRVGVSSTCSRVRLCVSSSASQSWRGTTPQYSDLSLPSELTLWVDPGEVCCRWVWRDWCIVIFRTAIIVFSHYSISKILQATAHSF